MSRAEWRVSLDGETWHPPIPSCDRVLVEEDRRGFHRALMLGVPLGLAMWTVIIWLVM